MEESEITLESLDQRVRRLEADQAGRVIDVACPGEVAKFVGIFRTDPTCSAMPHEPHPLPTPQSSG